MSLKREYWKLYAVNRRQREKLAKMSRMLESKMLSQILSVEHEQEMIELFRKEQINYAKSTQIIMDFDLAYPEMALAWRYEYNTKLKID